MANADFRSAGCLGADVLLALPAVLVMRWIGRRIPLKGTAVGAALRKPLEVQVVDGAVEEGVMAIACGIDRASPPTAVSVLAPNWRLERWGIEPAKRLVVAAARQVGELVSGFPKQ